MRYIIFLFSLSIIGLTGCTTIGQQITNHSGTIQIEQQNVPLNAQAAAGGSGNTPIYPISSNLRHYSVTPPTRPVCPPVQTITNTVVTYTNITNVVTSQENKTTNSVNTESVKKQETNNVTVNVYTEAVNIRQSSLLSDAFNYFMNE
jgi:hypothetical protein